MLWDSFDDGSSTVKEVCYGMSITALEYCGADKYENGYYCDGRYFDLEGNYAHVNAVELGHDSIEGLYVQEAQAMTASEDVAHYIKGTFPDAPLCYAPEDEVLFFHPVDGMNWEGLLTDSFEDLVPMDKSDLPAVGRRERVICGLETEDGSQQFIFVNDRYTNERWRRVMK